VWMEFSLPTGGDFRGAVRNLTVRSDRVTKHANTAPNSANAMMTFLFGYFSPDS
jgi:hypothetical protein